ncbi:SGNH/GDSL hydrolase family protein [Lactobacillus sp. ESL0731]|uniref:SGNH/GDSL hydrolase family protein n=1 Tax=unclassified Lactobacillus TaxID=2620435 RepID=UPI0023F7431B|nr:MULTISPECIES: SGNH/GDSL hydrolase family protein [unclassified Lactobacillus]WEV51290.1 SGNH/GDSL hydrolase family protein [Lactobacillus sp. ESL0700]WEV62420.1 SGNH/GDSL hydrolase family protein [Lactobacillus sp. ESL0731]
MKNIILFGDSLFNGYRNGHDTNLITNGLQKALGSGFHVTNFSQSGATTADGLMRLPLIDDNADLVVLEFGTNDAASDWGISSSRYEHNLEKMITAIDASRCVLVGPSYPNPDNKNIMQFYTAASLARYNEIAQKQALQHSIPFIDLIANLRNLPQLASYYQADGQHFSDLGNDLLINLVVNAIKEK